VMRYCSKCVVTEDLSTNRICLRIFVVYRIYVIDVSQSG
jgi:hypothetical protein